MKITYIGHSGFLVELQQVNILFDYYTGEIPCLPTNKPLYILVSHKHGDHFNPEIFQLEKIYPFIRFLLSYDIKITSFHLEKWEVSENVKNKIISVKAHERYELEHFSLDTLKSTDCGVAFLIKAEGHTIYHAGDLNWWCWNEDSKQESHNMTANFKREIERISDTPVDVAFLPLDPRQDNLYHQGMEYFILHVQTKYVFPMHFWEDYDICDRFVMEGHGKGTEAMVCRIHRVGESFTIQ